MDSPKTEQQSAAPESQQQGCCVARKALPGIRQRVYDIGYAISTVDQRSSGECVYVMELIDEALAAPSECDQWKAMLDVQADALMHRVREINQLRKQLEEEKQADVGTQEIVGKYMADCERLEAENAALVERVKLAESEWGRLSRRDFERMLTHRQQIQPPGTSSLGINPVTALNTHNPLIPHGLK